MHLSVKGHSLIDKQNGIEYSIKGEEKGLDVYDLLDVMV
jgi:hypothetical protein